MSEENTASESQRGAHIQATSPCGPISAPRSPSQATRSHATHGVELDRHALIYPLGPRIQPYVTRPDDRSSRHKPDLNGYATVRISVVPSREDSWPPRSTRPTTPDRQVGRDHPQSDPCSPRPAPVVPVPHPVGDGPGRGLGPRRPGNHHRRQRLEPAQQPQVTGSVVGRGRVRGRDRLPVREVAGALFFGRLSDRWGRRNLFVITLGVYLTGGAMTALTSGTVKAGSIISICADSSPAWASVASMPPSTRPLTS